nr:hypothetical protein [Tanacetum cinerariifolium]GEZ71019.1 hypothetical protein [Tanacetum cinerariifolium]
MDDSLEMAATTATSLDIEQDRGSEEVFVAQQDEKVVEKVVDAAQIQVTTAATTPTISIDEVTLAQDDVQAKINVDYQLAERLQAEEQQELNDEEKAKLFMQLLEKRRKFFTAKRAEEKKEQTTNSSSTKKNNVYLPQEYRRKKLTDLKNKSFDSIQEMFDRAFKKMFDRAFKRVNTFVDYKTELVKGSSKRAGTELEQGTSKKQKIDDDKETAELKQSVIIIPDEEGAAIDAIPLAVKPPINTTADTRVKTVSESYYCQYKEVTTAQDEVSAAQEL